MTNVELDHHTEFASLAELEDGVRGVDGARAARSCATRRAFEGELAVPGELNRRNAGTALAALELAGVARRRGRAGARALHRHGPPLRGLRGGRRDDRRRLRPSSERARRHDRGRARGVSRRGGCASSSSRTSTRARGISPRELGAALAAADDVAVTDVYPAREAPVDGVTGKLVVDALSDRGRARGVDADRRGRASRTSARRAEPGDVLLDDRRRRRRPRAGAAPRAARARGTAAAARARHQPRRPSCSRSVASVGARGDRQRAGEHRRSIAVEHVVVADRDGRVRDRVGVLAAVGRVLRERRDQRARSSRGRARPARAAAQDARVRREAHRRRRARSRTRRTAASASLDVARAGRRRAATCRVNG